MDTPDVRHGRSLVPNVGRLQHAEGAGGADGARRPVEGQDRVVRRNGATLLTFDGLARPIALVGCDQLVGYFPAIFHGWTYRQTRRTDTAPVISIRYDGQRYRLTSPWLGAPVHHRTAVDTICAFIVDLVKAFVADDPSLLCLHCGAAAFADRLVVFPSAYRAGKSTMMARLAAAGTPVYADDVLPVAGDAGVALGLAPRLRLPLPEGVGAAFRRFVDERAGPSNRHYLYLNLPSGELARHGERAPIGAIVLLDRQATGRTELAAAPRSAGLQRLILQNFARSIGAVEIVDRLSALVDRTPCLTLRYADLDEAVALLRERFGDGSGFSSNSRNAEAEPRAVPAAPQSDRVPRRHGRWGARAGHRFVRNPSIVLHAVDRDLVLVDPEREAIFHLNPVAAALWQLLDGPMSVEELAKVLQATFPAVEKGQIKRDVAALVRDLAANELVLPATE